MATFLPIYSDPRLEFGKTAGNLIPFSKYALPKRKRKC